MTKVLLLEKDGTKTPYEVEKLNLLQFSKTIKTVTDILQLATKNDAISELVDEVMFSASKEFSDEQEANEDDNVFKAQTMDALIVLLTEAPEKAFELLSILSGIKADHLMAQDIETAFDVYDAILGANDIEALITRAKKSLSATKQATAFMKKLQKATA